MFIILKNSLYRGFIPYILLYLWPGHRISFVISRTSLNRGSLNRGSTLYVYVASEGTNYISIFTLLFCSGLGHQHSKGANGSCYQSIFERNEPFQAMMSDDVSE